MAYSRAEGTSRVFALFFAAEEGSVEDEGVGDVHCGCGGEDDGGEGGA